MKTLGAIAVGSLAGVALAAAAALVVLTFGPESILDWGDIVYDAAGQYAGLR